MTFPSSPLQGQPLRGPRQLLETLQPAQNLPQLTLFGLNDSRTVDAEWQIQADLTQIPQLPNWPNLRKVALLQLPAETEIQKGREYLQKLELPLTETLDLLILQSDRWWSAICTDPNCCPPAGRVLAAAESVKLRRERWQEWCAAIASQNCTVHSELLQSLQDLKIRDALLVELLDASRAEQVLKLLSQLIEFSPDVALECLAAAHSVLAAGAYLADDCATAKHEIDTALSLFPGYSFAALLQRGLAVQAPAQLLALAFAESRGELSISERLESGV